MRFHHGLLLIAAALLVPSPARADEGRAIWLTRWSARTPGDVVSCLEGMVALRANILFVQVYGDGMALWSSSLVPRSPLVSGDADLLAVAVEEGHRRGIQVHAYVNVCNVYSGGLGPPGDPSHLVRAHPGWAVVDSSGRSDADLVGTSGSQIFFCPEWEGFRQHCVGVTTEIATEYEVDGIHLDYLRFPGGAPRCFCAEHRRKFRARFGREPEDTDPDFIEHRYETIAGLFEAIRDAVLEARPEAVLSATLVSPTGRYSQDSKTILERGLLDVAVPMIYTSDVARFQAEARAFHENSGGRLVFAGISIGSSEGRAGEEIAIARDVGLEGQALFTWSTLDDEARGQIAAAYATPADPPAMPWKDGSPDRVPPVLSGVETGGITAGEATILWHTDEPTRGSVAYGLTASMGSSQAESSFAFDHALRIGGLSPDTLYRFRVTAEDGASNDASSATLTFRTAAPGPVAFVVDDGDPGFGRGGSWASGSSPGGHDDDYLFSSTQAEETAWAEFRPYLPAAGRYEVSLWYVSGSNRAAEAAFLVRGREGNSTFAVDQRSDGARWKSLGTFRFDSGRDGYVRLSNRAKPGSVVIADAVRFTLIEADATFIRGDANADGIADLSDGVSILGFLYLGAASPPCLDAADADDSGELDMSDAVSLLGHLFLGAPPPPPPYPLPGTDPTPDELPDC